MGQAVRLALSQGMHTNIPTGQLPDDLIQRCRKIWWTIYVLDREMTSLMGLPQAVRDEDVQAPLPASEGDTFRSWAFTMRIKLSHFIASIDRSKLFLRYRLVLPWLINYSRVRARWTPPKRLFTSYQGSSRRYCRHD